MAAYFVEWTRGKVRDSGAHVDLVMGDWGEDTTAADRVAVALEFRATEKGPAFMVIDAAGRAFSGNELVGRALSRDEVINTPRAHRAFEIVDAIWTADGRIAEVRGDLLQPSGPSDKPPS